MCKKKWKPKVSIIVAGILMTSNLYCNIIFASSEDVNHEFVTELSGSEDVDTNIILEDKKEINKAIITDVTETVSPESNTENIDVIINSENAKSTANTYVGELYNIEKKSVKLSDNNGNTMYPSRLNMDFPRDGKVYFSNEPSEKCSFVNFLLDNYISDDLGNGIYPTKDISELSGEISAGQHYIYCYNLLGSPGSSYQEDYTTVSYSYHPLINIYYVINGHPYKLTDYYMEETPTQEKLPMPELEGYEIEGLYCDEEYTTPIEYYDTSIGQDLYVYAKVNNENVTDPSDEEYKIIRGSKKIGFAEYFHLEYFPTDGKIIFSDDKSPEDSSVSSYCLDYDDEIIGAGDYVRDVADLSGNISKGNHYIYLFIHPIIRTRTVNYTFYPKCRVYYVYENQTEELANYYLEESYSKLTLKAPDIPGYRTLGLYADRSLTIPVESVSKGIGKDWYVYPKVEPIKYSVIYDLDGGINNRENKDTYTIEDENFILQAPTKDGYIFEGWYTTPALKTKVTEITTSNCKNITLYAKWKKKTGSESITPTPSITPDPDKDPVITSTPVSGITYLFTDENFRAAIRELLGIGKNEPITEDACVSVKSLDIKGKNIKSLEGIECLPNLKYLNCSDNQLEYLDVSQNTALETLICSNNQLDSLDVSQNTALMHLDCSYNNINDIDDVIGKNNNLENFVFNPQNSLKQQELEVSPSILTLYVGGKPKSLKISNAKGKISYGSSNSSIVKVDSNGTATPISKGNASITVRATGDSSYKAAVKEIKVIVYGRPTKVTNVKVTPARSKRTVRASWGKVSSASGYILRYSYKKSMAGSKSVKLTRQDINAKMLKKLRSKKYVYIQVQAYIKDGNTLIKGPWSKVTRSKTKIK